VTLATHDNLNRLLTHQAGGTLQFKGTLSEPGTVLVNSKPAVVDAANRFVAGVPVPAGTTTVTINATDASGNASEAVYEVDQAGTGKTFTYDANGNMTSDGTRTFEWDARNQLVAVNVGAHRSEFTYDGRQRRVRELETEAGVIVSDSRFLQRASPTDFLSAERLRTAWSQSWKLRFTPSGFTRMLRDMTQHVPMQREDNVRRGAPGGLAPPPVLRRGSTSRQESARCSIAAEVSRCCLSRRSQPRPSRTAHEVSQPASSHTIRPTVDTPANPF